MKRLLALLLAILFVTSAFGCTHNVSSEIFPLATKPCYYGTVGNGDGGFVLGTDGKLWYTRSLWADAFDHPYTDFTQEELSLFEPERAAVLADMGDPFGISEYELLAENVADVEKHHTGIYVLFRDGKLFLYDYNENSKKIEKQPIMNDVAELIHERNDEFILADGRLIRDGTSYGKTEVSFLNGQKGYVVHENAKAFSRGLILETNGDLWATGVNCYGFRAEEPVDDLTVAEAMRVDPALLEYDPAKPNRVLTKVKAICSQGFTFGFAIREDNTLWAWGANEFGTIGNGEHGDGYVDTKETVTKPYKVLDNVKQVLLAGESVYIDDNMRNDTVVALTHDGDVYTWGSNEFGWLGNGTSAFGTEDPLLGCSATPAKILSGIKQLYRMESFWQTTLFALGEDGTLYSWGASTCGESGTGLQMMPYDSDGRQSAEYLVCSPTAIMENVVFFSGLKNAMAVTADGTVWGWGTNPFAMFVEPKWKRSYNPGPNEGENLMIFATPQKNPRLSATISADGTVSFVPTPIG